MKDAIAAALIEGRRRTEELLAPVDDERLSAQHTPLMSPLVWDYGHIAAYEELWLVQRLAGAKPIEEARMPLYDAFENPRRVRGGLPLLTRREASDYRDVVDGRALDLLGEVELDGPDPLLDSAYIYRMIIEHEGQHQETILQALQLIPGGYRPPLPAPPAGGHLDLDMVEIPAGRYPVGAPGHAPWDNEHPVHEVEVAAYAIDRHPVTCGQYLGFIEDGGYRRSELWAPAGWCWVEENGITAPQGWRRDGGSWMTDRFGHAVPVDWDTPVVHVCWYEADAFARWSGRRLPTEAEWEIAAAFDPASGNAFRHPWGDDPPQPDLANLDQRLFGCAPVGAYPRGASPFGCEQMEGDVWEWTASDLVAYPGFSAFPYPEYSEVFFGGDYKVLRGGSWATRSNVARTTFRNWDHPIRRQIFSGFRRAAGAG